MRDDFPTLHGERVTIRPLQERDLPRMLEILNQPGVREWWPDYDAARLRAEALEDEALDSFAVELGAEVVGLLYVTEENDPHYRYAALDISLDAGHLGQGLGSDTLRTMARHLFEQRGHHRLSIDPAVINERAIGAYKKVGFKPVGVMRCYELGRDGWRDALLMDMLAGELT